MRGSWLSGGCSPIGSHRQRHGEMPFTVKATWAFPSSIRCSDTVCPWVLEAARSDVKLRESSPKSQKIRAYPKLEKRVRIECA